MRQAWRDIGKVFVIAAALDFTYQVSVHHAVFFLELVITASLLALLPYALVRGPACRLARWVFSLRERRLVQARYDESRSRSCLSEWRGE